VIEPGPAELSQRWQADARARAAQAVSQALDNWEALAQRSGGSGADQQQGRSSSGSRPAGSGSDEQGLRQR
jgi:hypothetical protein